MGNYLIVKGDTLSQIVQKKYGLHGWVNIKKKCEEIAALNGISNIDLIYAGKSLNLPDESNSVFNTGAGKNASTVSKPVKPVEPAKNSNPPPENNTSLVPVKETPEAKGAADVIEEPKIVGTELDEWEDNVFDSMSATGKFSSNVKSFEILSVENYQKDSGKYALKNQNYDVAYKEHLLGISKEQIAAYDRKHPDGKIDDFEQFEGDMARYETKHGKMDEYAQKTMIGTSSKTNTFMDLNGDGKVDEKEYAAFLYAMDANNKEGSIDGNISADEYVKTKMLISNSKSEGTTKFMQLMRSCYQALFGTDPTNKK